jgi:DNA-binding ferritin-like protein
MVNIKDPQSLSSLVQTEEPDDYSTKSFAGKLLSAVAQLHVWHWQVKNEAAHTALGLLYDSIGEFVDSIVEKYMSDGPVIVDVQLEQPKNFADIVQVQEYLDYCIEYANEHKIMCERADIRNILDELVAPSV